MNVVVGNSIKIETSLNIGTERFKKRYFNSSQWSAFLFSSQSKPDQTKDITFEAFEYLGNNRLILEDDEILVDSLITNHSESVTHLVIVVDVYNDDFDLNKIVNNIVDHAEFNS